MTAILDTCIGLALMYLLSSLLISALVEYIAALWKKRAKVLRDALNSSLGASQKLMNSPLLTATKPGGKDPSYLHPTLFAQALMQQATAPDTTLPMEGKALYAALEAAPAVEAARQQHTDPNVPLQQEIEKWFEECMKRWEGVYVRWSQQISLLLCLALVPILNINTVTVAQALWTQPELRASVVEKAMSMQQAASAQSDVAVSPAKTTPEHPVGQAAATLKSLDLPLGWGNVKAETDQEKFLYALRSLPGWLLSILAISAGARFWFDALNRLVNLRLTGQPPKDQTS